MSVSQTHLNRIKIKDLMASIKQDVDMTRGMGLYYIGLLEKIEISSLKDATNDDVRRIEKKFIESKLGIKYYPSQRKKTIIINGMSKIVPIDYLYGSEDA